MVESFEQGWLAKGRAEGRAKGRAEGRAEGRRHSLMRLIAWRFGSEQAEAVAPRIEGVTSIDALDALFDRALVDPTNEGLLEKLDCLDRGLRA